MQRGNYDRISSYITWETMGERIASRSQHIPIGLKPSSQLE